MGQHYNMHCSNQQGETGNTFVLIVVLFILLVIVGAAIC